MTKKERTSKCYDCGDEFLFVLGGWIVCPKCRRKKKWRTWKACRKLAAKYREPEGKVFFNYSECPLCQITVDAFCGDCRGCPLAYKNGTKGCGKFRTYRRAYARAYERYSFNLAFTPDVVTFNARAAFFDKIIPILEKIPAKRFTKKGWRYFDELDRSW